MTGDKERKGFAVSIALGGPHVGKHRPASGKEEDGESDDGESGDGDDSEGTAMAGEDLAAALKGGKGQEIADAFKALSDLVM